MPMAPPPDLLNRFRSDLAALGCAPDADRPLGIAVSGGPDSLALLILARAVFPGAVTAATVDHGLRAEAAAEALAVAELCRRIGVPHAILTAPADALTGKGSVQARARAVRYELLARWGKEAKVGWIATAHHLDDQAETFLMRAARGAGLAGLAGVRERTEIAGATVIRPLLAWRRGTLAGIVAAAGENPADDPSNRNPAYDRTAFRDLLARTPRLEPERLARAAANLADAEEAVAWAIAGLASDRLHEGPGGLRLIAPDRLPREIRRRLTASALARLSDAPEIRGGSVDRLLRLLESGRQGTLAGILVKPGVDWSFTPAPPRRR
jgi:tRNA(Ile)-lysidine synthase